MTGNVVARRYAKALFSLAAKQGKEAPAVYGREVADIAKLVGELPMLAKVFKTPAFSKAEKVAAVQKVSASIKPSKPVEAFLGILAENDRLALLPDIAAAYSVMLDQTLGVMRGKLTTAVKLAAKRQSAIKSKLEAQTGKKLELDYAVDSSILGGLVLQIGDKVLDASLKAQLSMMQEQITRGE